MIRISAGDIDFLLTMPDLPEQILATLARARAAGGSLTDDDADALRDYCGEQLQVHGFGPNYEANDQGRRLEDLIDRLFLG